MTSKDEVWSELRQRYERYRNDGLIGRAGPWSWYDEATAELRSQEWLTFLELLRLRGVSMEGATVLDVGCGNGRWLRACLDLGVEPGSAIGVELLDWRIEEARRLSPNMSFLQSSGAEIDLPAGSVDLAAASLLFSSIPTAKARVEVASEIARVVRPGGFIYIYDLPRVVGDPAQPVDATELFPDWKWLERPVGRRLNPRDSIRSLRGVGSLVGRLIAPLGHRPSHKAVLLGPKSGID